jgi:tetratricopeptide (TPR) repeat protein
MSISALLGMTLMIFSGGGPAPAYSDSRAPLRSDTLKTGSFDEKLNRGVEAFYRTDWELAADIFEDLKVEAPDDPMPWFFSSMMPFWEYFFIEQTGDKAREFLAESEKAVELSQERLDRSPSDTTMVLMLSGLHGYRSLVAAGESNYRVAISSGLTGFNFTRKLLALGSDRPDARIGRGMFFYMVGSIPREMRWASNLVGLRADAEQGFEELKMAAESDSYVSIDAKMMLMYLYNKEGRHEESLHYAGELTKSHPENIIFRFKKAEILENAGNKAEAMALYEEITAEEKPGFDNLQRLAGNRLEELKNLSLKH